MADVLARGEATRDVGRHIPGREQVDVGVRDHALHQLVLGQGMAEGAALQAIGLGNLHGAGGTAV